MKNTQEIKKKNKHIDNRPVTTTGKSDSFLKIPSDIYGEIMGLVNGCEIEISWLGQVRPLGDGYIVTKIHVLKQECSGVETTLDADAIAMLDYECTDGKYKKYGDLLWWGHSHVDMSAFWSSTDHDAMKTLSGVGCLVISTVFNRRREMRTAYRQGKSIDGFYPEVFKDELSTEIVASGGILKLISDNVSRESSFIPPMFKQKDMDLDSMIIPMHESNAIDMGMICMDEKKLIKEFSLAEMIPLDIAEEIYDEFVEECLAKPRYVSELSLYLNTGYNIERER